MRKKLLLAMGLGLFSGLAFSQSPISGYPGANAAQQQKWEAAFDQSLQASNVDKLLKDMSAKPHAMGSPGTKAVAEYINNYFLSLGIDSKVEVLYSLFSTPKERVLELTGPVKFKAVLSEPALKEDATSNQTAEQLPTYNCWSADGDVTAELVFVNYGLPEDYEFLREKGIDVKGKIVIAKYGRSWRGIKPKVAQEHGAIGCLIYSDPMDDGYFQGDVYPQGAFKNEWGVQRGSVMDMPIYPGDPLTPGYGHSKDAKTLDKSEVINLLKIPVLPISYHDALPLLKQLTGPVAPDAWRGALPITYHVGPSTTKVHLKLAFNWEVKPVYNVIATIKGTEFPDEWIIRGNHHDAWVNGASDPLSGMAALMEEARGISLLMKQGWKPKRTIIFCGWDGEEPGLLGSTEWAEFHQKELAEKAVLYINSDGNGRGFLGAAGSHALEPFMNEVARDVIDPQTDVSVLERNRARAITNASSVAAKKNLLAKKTISIGALGAGSDYSPFFQHIGIPSLNLGFGGENEGGEYHSIYDSYDNYRRFKDPEFAYGVALAKTAGRVTMRFANAEVLPFDYASLQKTISGYVTEVVALADNLREATQVENQIIKEKKYTLAADPREVYNAPLPKDEVPYLEFASLHNAVAALSQATTALTAVLQKTGLTAAQQTELNKHLYLAEQSLLLEQGLPRRPWYKHSIYAPGFYTGYGVKTLPGIREAIEQRSWKEAQEQIVLAAKAIENLAAYLTKTAASIK
ncbi:MULTISPECIES: transferrin receptor-like dimerization domain-containing protein [unclassified Paraflavitalea]|uniref:transferrin receptor-like dimerization domain-containing protein n=1 Tax=unclassified Paraflavitalea TaxID=2798305 RepID=UPI003D352D9E